MEIIIKIDGMSCNHCLMSVEKKLSKLNVNKIKVEIGSAEVEFDESKISEEEIFKSIEEAGYRIVK